MRRTLGGTDSVQVMTQLQTYLVEDSPVIRVSLIATLEELTPVKVMGYAEDETSALVWLAAHTVDLVIIDLFLKSGSGLGLLRAAQMIKPNGRSAGMADVGYKDGRGQRAHQVVLSNYATPAMRERCLALGADSVFDKSTEIDALIAYCQALAHQLH